MCVVADTGLENGGVASPAEEEGDEDVEAGCVQKCRARVPAPIARLAATNRFKNLHVSILHHFDGSENHSGR